MTLFVATGLVIVVVFVFLQNWRATLIPLLTVPVAIIGTFALFPAAGLLDQHDQHVRPGAGHRHCGGRRDRGGGGGAAAHRRGTSAAREAAIRAMEEVSAPVVAIACILAAAFIPVAFLGGISGQIYKQFALTIAASVLISAFNALSLSPALSAILLRPKMKTPRACWPVFFGGFDRGFERTRSRIWQVSAR